MANIIGTEGDDLLTGTSSADSIEGLASDDVLAGGPGNDTLNGGAGYDAVDYSAAAGAVTVNLAADTASGAHGNDLLISIEDAWGSDFDDLLIGDAGTNVLRGQRGNDTLDGGAGYDVADYSEAAGPVAVNLAAATANGADGNDVLISIEDVWGSVFDDMLTGDAGDNILFADGGDDTLVGSFGNDILDGGAGFDSAIYTGSRTAYTITSAGFYQVISGSEGADTLTGVERLQFADMNVAFDLERGDPSGNAVRLIGAGFGTQYLTPEVIGIVVGIFDAGYTMPAVCEAALSVMGSPGNLEFVRTIYRNVVETDPPPATEAYLVGLLVGSGGTMAQAQMLEIVANLDLNEQHIGLVGMQQSGVEFV